MSDPVLISLVSALGLILSGVLVELVRSRRATRAVAQAVQTPAGDHSVAELVSSTSADVKDIKNTQQDHGIRLAVLERRFDDHLDSPRLNGKVRR